MKILIAGIGRCGSNMITAFIAKSFGINLKFTNSYRGLVSSDKYVFKTHLHFNREIPSDYRILFLYDDIDLVIASLYKIWGDKLFYERWSKETADSLAVCSTNRVKNKGSSYPVNLASGKYTGDKKMLYKAWFLEHLTHLQVKKYHIKIFFTIARLNKLVAFLYMVIGDKFQFKRNMESWRRSKRCLFVKYSWMLKNKELVFKNISNFLEQAINPDEINVMKRKSKKEDLPLILRKAIQFTYGEWFATLDKILLKDLLERRCF